MEKKRDMRYNFKYCVINRGLYTEYKGEEGLHKDHLVSAPGSLVDAKGIH